jgi:arginyl-tRNA synthetase
MQVFKNQLKALVAEGLKSLYGIEGASIEFQATRKEFIGDLTLVVFPWTKASKKSPEATAQELGEWLVQREPRLQGHQVVKGFLNLALSDAFWLEHYRAMAAHAHFGTRTYVEGGPVTMVEYSSPNTNKPLHLGHIRNNLLGYSIANILQANGHRVVKVQIINDRGIHICKSMLAWQRLGNGETPASSGLKGDKLVGKYYVAFDRAYREELKALMEQGLDEKAAEAASEWMQAARQMLLDWEAGNPEVKALWNTMNQWVYAGFDATYKALGVDFERNYYESNTYLLGKEVVEEGLAKGVFYRRSDGSVWVDLTADGLDEKLLLRSDGTSVYMTQDLGTAVQRFRDFPIQGLVYTVGNEQDYHFQVLFLILKKMGYAWAEKLYHLSYGMVDLPSGKMKSREGTVVDADDLMDEMRNTARDISENLGKLEGLAPAEKEELYRIIGLGALKYYILKVDPKKRMLFNPEESIDFNGNTGPFIQYTHARIQSLLRKAGGAPEVGAVPATMVAEERDLIKALSGFPEVVELAAESYSPYLVAQYTYDLVKSYNALYQNHSILQAPEPEVVQFRLGLSEVTARVVRTAMGLLGIECPERM